MNQTAKNVLQHLTPRKLALAGFLVCVGLIGTALYMQYVVGLEPCPLCMLQRLTFFAIAIICLIATIHGPKGIGGAIYGALMVIGSGTGICLATRHVWLQYNPPLYSACTGDLFYQLGKFPILDVVHRALIATGDCAVVDWTFLGLSMAGWALVWFVLLLLLAGWVIAVSLRKKTV